MKIAIIGGGASGLYCAMQLKKQQPSWDVHIYEKNEKVGRKILMTGNGRGNISNIHFEDNPYNNHFGYAIAQQHSSNDLRTEFQKIGLLTYQDDHGRIYPLSDTANTIVDCLRLQNKNHQVLEFTNSEVINLRMLDQQWEIVTPQNSTRYDYVVVGCGTGAGYKKTGTNPLEDCFSTMGYTFTSLYPALSALNVHQNLASLNGLRRDVHAEIWINDQRIYANLGEVLFKDDSLSGIVIFELSSFYARSMATKQLKKAKIVLDLLPQMSQQELISQLTYVKQINAKNDCVDLLIGIFPKALGQFIIKSSGIDLHQPIQTLTEEEIHRIAQNCKELTFTVDTKRQASNFQVYSGGLEIAQVDEKTLQSKKHPHLYFMGEFLDVDGLCGGFNLHFAFASAYLVAQAIGDETHA